VGSVDSGACCLRMTVRDSNRESRAKGEAGMKQGLGWGQRVGLLLVWVLATAGIAFLVARTATHESSADLTAPQPVVSSSQRVTVSLTETMIVPIVSGDGSVVASPSGYLLEAPVSTDDLAYRLLDPPVGVKALIKGGPAGFECIWVGLGQPGVISTPAASPSASPAATPMAGVHIRGFFAGGGDDAASSGSSGISGSGPGVVMRCAIPKDVRVITGLRGTMVLQMAKPITAQALPVSAVVGSSGQGQVIVVHDNGSAEIRTVQLGASDIYNIEITSGLQPMDKVLQNPVQEDFQAAGAP